MPNYEPWGQELPKIGLYLAGCIDDSRPFKIRVIETSNCPIHFFKLVVWYQNL